MSWLGVVAVMIVLIGACLPRGRRAQALEPIVYTVRVPKPDSHAAEIEAVFPTAGRPAIEIMMAVWSPGLLSRRGLRETGRGSLGQSA